MPLRELPYAWVLSAIVVSVGLAVLTGQPGFALLAPAAVLMMYLLPDPQLLLYALFLSIPFSAEVQVTPSLGTDMPDEPLMWICSVVVMFLLYRERARVASLVSHPIVALILLSWLWCWISLLHADNRVLALKFILAKSWYLLPFLFGSLLLLDSASRLRRAVAVLVVPMVLLSVVTLVRHAFTGFNFNDVSRVVWPYFRNHVNYSALMVCCIPPAYLLFRRTGKPFWMFAMFILPVALYFSYSRGAWLALMAGAITVFLIRRRWLVSAAASLMVVLTLFSFWLARDNNYLRFRPDFERTIYHAALGDHLAATVRMKDISTAERFYRWIAAARIWNEHPVTGVGPNHFVPVYRSYTVESFRTYVSDNPERSTVHNYFLLLLSEQGLPAVLIFLLTLFAMFRTAQRAYERGDEQEKAIALCAGAVLSMIVVLVSLSDLIETDKIGPLFYLCAAVLVSLSSGSYVKRVPQPVAQDVE
jgi:O-antigen ligase